MNLPLEAGVVFKGRQVLIPESMINGNLTQLHAAHQGIVKTHRLAWESVYWAKINTDIEKMCRSCNTCEEHQDAHTKEPLIPHKTPTKPWQCLVADLFEIHGHQYLLTVDRYSHNDPLVDEMPIPASSYAVAQKMQMYMSLFGQPDEIVTDNGPQYTGQPFRKSIVDWGIILYVRLSGITSGTNKSTYQLLGGIQT